MPTGPKGEKRPANPLYEQANNPAYEGLSMQNERTGGDNPSISAAAAKVEELLAPNPTVTDKVRFKMFGEWLKDNPEHLTAIDAYFFNHPSPAPVPFPSLHEQTRS
jgi:hypothetical protein